LENLESAKVARSAIASVNPSNELRKERNRRTAQVENKVETYKVQRGDTMVSIARKFDTNPGKLALLNNLKTWRTQVKIGQILKVSGENEASPATTIAQTKVKTQPKVKVTNSPIVYKVKPGDNLTNIAKVFDLNLTKIKKANNIKKGHIMVGQKIVLPDTKKGIYTVKKGDHLTKVARKFNQDMEALIKINSLKAGTIYPGQKLIVNMD
jgi:LysM repeat protein